VQTNPTLLILILADLATDHRCRKIAASARRLGYRPIVLCDRPLRPLGPSWEGIEVRILTRASHYRGFVKALLEYLVRATPILLRDPGPAWIVEDGTPLFWAALLGRLRGKRVVYDAREILLETPAIRSRASRRLAWRPWLWAGEALCGPLLTVSPGFADHYRARHPGRPVLLLPNVPEASPDPSNVHVTLPEAGPVRIIYQGALRPASGLRELLAALTEAPGYALDIYGDGPERNDLETLAAGLGERVRLHGAVPFEDLAAPMARAHIGAHLLLPSCRSFDLTWSNKLFDYVKAGLPCLLGPTEGHRAFLKREPVGVIPAGMGPGALRAALEDLRAGYPRYAAACAAARARLHWEAFSGALAAALDGSALPGREAG
jgi:glycosyltransferase involved in cell wall biosynthesis